MKTQLEQPQTTESYRHRSLSISHNGAVALAYAEAGIPVFPCAASGPRCKQPLTEHGHHDATTDLDQIRRWWTRWPDALVGIPTGPDSGVWVLDVDGRRLMVFRDPVPLPQGLGATAYRTHLTLDAAAAVSPLAAPAATIRVADLLP